LQHKVIGEENVGEAEVALHLVGFFDLVEVFADVFGLGPAHRKVCSMTFAADGEVGGADLDMLRVIKSVDRVVQRFEKVLQGAAMGWLAGDVGFEVALDFVEISADGGVGIMPGGHRCGE